MQCEWRYRRDTYYAMNPIEEQTDALGENIGDYVNEGEQYRVIYKNENIVQDAMDYIYGEPKELIYPAKSYAIAIIYALSLKEEFGGNLFGYLKSTDLLIGDPHFEPMQDSNFEIYMSIVETLMRDIEDRDWPKRLGTWAKMTHNYFLQEFMLDECGKAILPRG